MRRKILNYLSLTFVPTIMLSAVACSSKVLDKEDNNKTPNENNDPNDDSNDTDGPKKNVAHRSTDEEMINLGDTWEARLKNDGETPTTHIWNADESATIADILEQMNEQVGFFFLRKIENMSVFEFCKYLVDMYNNNGGGNLAFTINYKGETETVSINFNKVLKDLIVSLDDPSNIIVPNTAKEEVSPALGDAALEVAAKAGMDMMGGMMWMVTLFKEIGPQVFGIDDFMDLMDPSSLDPSIIPRASEIMSLLKSLPSATINQFTNLTTLFTDMSDLFTNSEIAKKWASDNGLTKEFEELKFIMTKTIMFSGL